MIRRLIQSLLLLNQRCFSALGLLAFALFTLAVAPIAVAEEVEVMVDAETRYLNAGFECGTPEECLAKQQAISESTLVGTDASVILSLGGPYEQAQNLPDSINGKQASYCITRDFTDFNGEQSIRECFYILTINAYCDASQHSGAWSTKPKNEGQGKDILYKQFQNAQSILDMKDATRAVCKAKKEPEISIEKTEPAPTICELPLSPEKTEKNTPTVLKGASDPIGNPIQPANGIKRHVEALFVDPRGTLDFDLTYTSQRTNLQRRLVGIGRFTHRFDTKLFDGSPDAQSPSGCMPGTVKTRRFVDGQIVDVSESHCFRRVANGQIEDPFDPGRALGIAFESSNGHIVQFDGDTAAPTQSGTQDRLELIDDPDSSIRWRLIRNSNGSIESYDKKSQMVRIDYIDGGYLSLLYTDTPDAQYPLPGLIKSVTDHYGRVLGFSYDEQGNLSQFTDPMGQQYQLGYDEESSICDTCSNLTSIVFPDGKIKKFHYELEDEAGLSSARLLTGVTNENGVRIGTYAYNSGGFAIDSSGPDGINRSLLEYQDTSSTRSVQITDARGAVYSREYRKIQDVFRVTEYGQPAGAGCDAATKTQQYDSRGNVLSMTDFNDNATQYTYDAERNIPLTRTEAAGSPQQRLTTYSWHPDWQLIAREAAPKRITSFVYNGQADPGGNGAVLTCAPPDAQVNGKPLAVLCARIEQATTDETGALGLEAEVTGGRRIWRYTYNAFGQILSVREPRNDGGVPRTTFSYYPDSQEKWQAGDLRSVTNPVGHRTRFTQYDGNGRLQRTIDANNVVTDIEYAARGWVTAVKKRPYGGGSVLVTLMDYDAVGNRTYLRAPDFEISRYFYDSANRLVGIADRLRNLRSYRYDKTSNIIQAEVRDSQNVLREVLVRSFDPLNRMDSMTRLPADDPRVTSASTIEWYAGSGDVVLGPETAVIGQPVNLQVVVSPVDQNAPTGTVLFKRGSLLIGSANLVKDVTTNQAFATFVTRELPLGANPIRAFYVGDDQTPSGQSERLDITIIDRQATALTINVSSSAPNVVAQPVTYDIAITGLLLEENDTGSLVNETVQITRDGVAVAEATLVPVEGVDGQYTVQVTEAVATPGSYTVEVNFAGNASSLPSTITLPIVVDDRAVTTTSFSAVPWLFPDPESITTTETEIRLSAQINGAYLIGEDYGMVEFVAGTEVLTASPVSRDADGTLWARASVTLNRPVGTYTLTARYLGNASSGPSVGNGVDIDIEPKTTATFQFVMARFFETPTLELSPPPTTVLGQGFETTVEVLDFIRDRVDALPDDEGKGIVVLEVDGIEIDRQFVKRRSQVDFNAPLNNRRDIDGAVLRITKEAEVQPPMLIGQHEVVVKYLGNRSTEPAILSAATIEVLPPIVPTIVAPVQYVVPAADATFVINGTYISEIATNTFSDVPERYGQAVFKIDGDIVAEFYPENSRDHNSDDWEGDFRIRPVGIPTPVPGAYELTIEYSGTTSTAAVSKTVPLYVVPIEPSLITSDVSASAEASDFDATVYLPEIDAPESPEGLSIEAFIANVSAGTATVESEPSPGVWPHPYRATWQLPVPALSDPAVGENFELRFESAATSVFASVSATATLVVAAPIPTPTIVASDIYTERYPSGSSFDATAYVGAASGLSTADTIDILIDGVVVATSALESEPSAGAWPQPFRVLASLATPDVGQYNLTYRFNGNAELGSQEMAVQLNVNPPL